VATKLSRYGGSTHVQVLRFRLQLRFKIAMFFVHNLCSILKRGKPNIQQRQFGLTLNV
jgi:hypothetical protein